AGSSTLSLPDALPISVHRVLDGVGALGQRRAAAVLEVIDATRAHVLVLDAAEVDPHLAVLVAELRREAQVLLALEMPPAAVVGRSDEHTSELQSREKR